MDVPVEVQFQLAHFACALVSEQGTAAVQAGPEPSGAAYSSIGGGGVAPAPSAMASEAVVAVMVSTETRTDRSTSGCQFRAGGFPPDKQ
jgi:hypothetical protein